MKTLFKFFTLSSFGLTLFFVYWTYRDNSELMKAYKSGYEFAEQRHRINVGFDLTWAMMSAMTMV